LPFSRTAPDSVWPDPAPSRPGQAVAGSPVGRHRTTACRWGRPLVLALLPCFFSACQTVHEVTIDAISSSRQPPGTSYHLEVRDPSGGVDNSLATQVATTIQDALAARGYYPVPARTQPDLVINVDYGVGQAHIKIVNNRNTDMLLGGGMTPANNSKAVVVFNKFIELSAREPTTGARPDGPGPAKPGDEFWNLRASIEDTKNELGPYVTIMAAAILDYIGTNTGHEVRLPLRADQAEAIMIRRNPQPAPRK